MRIDRIPGKSTVGIEVPNDDRATIVLREMVESSEYQHSNFKLPLALGKDIRGKIVVSDLQKMPHLLAAGSTGTGKSVSINAMILSLLYRSRPDQVKMIMIDPKRLELGLYQDIPHLLVPVVTEPHTMTFAPETYDRAMFTEKCNVVFETMLSYASQGVKWAVAAL